MDLADTIIPKSDQLNYDDLIAGPVTVTVKAVSRGNADQPVNIDVGLNRPYKPCKSMRRVLIAAWGKDGSKWVGKSMTLYGNSSVKWAGQEVGGIRISHLSDIAEPLTIAMTVSKGKRQKETFNVLQTVSRADKCRSWLIQKGIAESDAVEMIGKPLEQATEADFKRIGTMQPEPKGE